MTLATKAELAAYPVQLGSGVLPVIVVMVGCAGNEWVSVKPPAAVIGTLTFCVTVPWLFCACTVNVSGPGAAGAVPEITAPAIAMPEGLTVRLKVGAGLPDAVTV